MVKVALKKGRPPLTRTVVEELLMEAQATAMRGAEESELKREVREMFIRIARAVWYAQAVNIGIRTPGNEFNEHLAELLGEERLS